MRKFRQVIGPDLRPPPGVPGRFLASGFKPAQARSRGRGLYLLALD